MTVKSETTGLFGGGSNGSGSGAGNATPGIGPSSVSTRYYFSPSVLPAATASAILADRAYYQPMLFPGMLIDRIGVEVTTGAAGLCRLGIYSNLNGAPDTLILDAGTVDTTNIAVVEATITALYLPAAWVWVCALFNATPTMRVGSGNSGGTLVGASSFQANPRGSIATLAFAALPAAASLVSYNPVTQAPMISVRKT